MPAGSVSPAASVSSAPYPTGKASQISDGQIQATGAAAPSTNMMGNSTVSFTGAGVKAVASVGGVMAVLAAAIAAL